MPLIHCLTTRYRDVQDRVYLAAKDELGQVTGLWLTRRLADRLVKKLSAHLDDARQGVQPPSPAQSAVQVWQQSIAQARQAPVKPVPDPAQEREALIESVGIAQARDGIRLEFRCDNGVILGLVLGSTQIRQWMAVLYRNYMVAEWPVQGVWPHWFHDATSQSLAPSSSGLPVH